MKWCWQFLEAIRWLRRWYCKEQGSQHEACLSRKVCYLQDYKIWKIKYKQDSTVHSTMIPPTNYLPYSSQVPQRIPTARPDRVAFSATSMQNASITDGRIGWIGLRELKLYCSCMQQHLQGTRKHSRHARSHRRMACYPPTITIPPFSSMARAGGYNMVAVAARMYYDKGRASLRGRAWEGSTRTATVPVPGRGSGCRATCLTNIWPLVNFHSLGCALLHPVALRQRRRWWPKKHHPQLRAPNLVSRHGKIRTLRIGVWTRCIWCERKMSHMLCWQGGVGWRCVSTWYYTSYHLRFFLPGYQCYLVQWRS